MVRVIKSKHVALGPKNLSEAAFRCALDQYTANRKCCRICGDEQKLVEVAFSNAPNMLFCEFCYKIQINMS